MGVRAPRRRVRLTPHQFGYGWQIFDDTTGEMILDVVHLDIEASVDSETLVRLVHLDLEQMRGGWSGTAFPRWAEWCTAVFTPPDPDHLVWRPPAHAHEGT